MIDGKFEAKLKLQLMNAAENIILRAALKARRNLQSAADKN